VDKKANVISRFDEVQDIIMVNLTTGPMEGVASYPTRIEKLKSKYLFPIKPIK